MRFSRFFNRSPGNRGRQFLKKRLFPVLWYLFVHFSVVFGKPKWSHHFLGENLFGLKRVSSLLFHILPLDTKKSAAFGNIVTKRKNFLVITDSE